MPCSLEPGQEKCSKVSSTMVRAISLGPLLAGASAFQHQACRRRILPFLLPIEASNLVAGRQRSSLMFATNVGDMETKTSADDENTIPVLLESEAATKFMDNERSTGFVVESYSSATDTALLVAVEAPSSESWVDSPLLWKGVVAILCGLWASNFAAAKLIMAEPGKRYYDGFL